MNQPLDNQERAKYVIICFYITLGAYALMLVSDYMEYQLLSTRFFGMDEATANDQRQSIIGLLSLGAQIALIITFIQWFRRAYHNLHKIGERDLLTSEGWAAGAWFVPILSLFRPYQIMVEISKRTKSFVLRNDNNVEFDNSEIRISDNKSDLRIILLWWISWIVTSIASNISFQITRNGVDVDTFIYSNVVGMFSDAVGIISIIFAIKMVKSSQNDQNRLLNAWKNQKSETTSFVLHDSDEILI